MKNNHLSGLSILITGGSGSWGNELVTQLLKNHQPKEIKIYSRGEHKQVEMKRKFQNSRLQFIIGDVRDKNKMRLSMEGVDLVFHLAALKHVPICEENPWETVQTNVIGIQNVIEAAIENGVQKVVDISTDKAVDPFNLYGVTKASGEKLMIAANQYSQHTQFVCIRGGNVLGTNGSVVPLFKEQIKVLNELTLTDPRMTRFMMRVEDAIKLVLHATAHAVGGEVFVMKTPSCRIPELAAVLIKRLGNQDTKVKTIGIRPGEKLSEVLVSRYEMPRTLEDDEYFIILPQIHLSRTEDHYAKHRGLKFKHPEFNSDNTHIMKPQELEALLDVDGWLDDNEKQQALQYLSTLSKSDLENYFQTEGWGTTKGD